VRDWAAGLSITAASGLDTMPDPLVEQLVTVPSGTVTEHYEITPNDVRSVRIDQPGTYRIVRDGAALRAVALHQPAPN
jgi:hypothetical protein